MFFNKDAYNFIEFIHIKFWKLVYWKTCYSKSKFYKFETFAANAQRNDFK